MKWFAGDLFTIGEHDARIWRVRRVKGSTVWFLSNRFGENPPKGILQSATPLQRESWVKVQRTYL